MKNIQAIKLNKYEDESQYEEINNCFYRCKVDGRYCIALSCELEDGEDSQYPLEDILDEYYVNCTDYFEERQNGDISMLLFELEGSLDEPDEDYKNIRAVSELIGKRVYNKEDNGVNTFIIE